MGNNFLEMLATGQLFGGLGGSQWLSVAMLAGLFAILIFRRDAIAIPGLFKLSWFLFAASVVAPAVLMPLITLNDPYSGGSSGDVSFLLRMLAFGGGPGCLALSMCTLVSSMFVRNLRAPPVIGPTKHPLD